MKVPFPCHSYGMVGFVKELVDEQGAANIAMGSKAGWRKSKFKNILITPGIVIVAKAASTLTAPPNEIANGTHETVSGSATYCASERAGVSNPESDRPV